MKLTPKMLTWILRFYPPFLCQRIWVKKIHADFSQVDIKIFKSFLNINSNKTIFGGTMFSAVDPIHPILLDQLFQKNGYSKTVAWLKSAKISYLKPAKKNLNFSITLAATDIEEAFQSLAQQGRVIKTFEINIYDMDGTLCARSQNEVYIRNLAFTNKALNTNRDLIL